MIISLKHNFEITHSCTSHHVIVLYMQSSRESLGISVSGGRGGPKGDVPIFVTSVQPDGPVGRHHYLRVSQGIVK